MSLPTDLSAQPAARAQPPFQTVAQVDSAILQVAMPIHGGVEVGVQFRAQNAADAEQRIEALLQLYRQRQLFTNK